MDFEKDRFNKNEYDKMNKEKSRQELEKMQNLLIELDKQQYSIESKKKIIIASKFSVKY